jgi:hypothetical protein
VRHGFFPDVGNIPLIFPNVLLLNIWIHIYCLLACALDGAIPFVDPFLFSYHGGRAILEGEAQPENCIFNIKLNNDRK